MLPSLLDSTTIPALAETMQFAQARHTVLAGNLANIHVPGYKTRDLSVDVFQERLKEALAAGGPKQDPRSPGFVTGDADDPMRRVRDSLTNILYHDETNIDLEKLTAEVNKNQFLHNFALTVMTDQFQLLQTAISERI
ncbi:MAG TPA: flagellar basal body rod protein FlgB [Pirellulaceae bacterium]|nr:flagellar basal body rod protein FlgB [Pirellulaceae bacterium]